MQAVKTESKEERVAAGAADPGAWYRTARRWGQTNLVEIDPGRYDGAWWREHWRRTRVQGVIVNAGGIVAYYPSAFPLHHRAIALGERDLFGEIVGDARSAGLTVVARMDSNRVAEDFFQAHPDWICVDAAGKPYRQADKYVTCINSPYYGEYLPGVMEEIIRRYHPDGFSDNSWPGLPRERICHCANCAARFRAWSGHDLPEQADWQDDAYRLWIRWSYARRNEQWVFNNAVTTRAGGPDCLWSGMISGDLLANGNRFVDLRFILAHTDIVMLDHQRRNGIDGFEQNTEAGKRLHELAGWEKLVPESTPQYQLGSPPFRLAAMPTAEVRLWSSAGFAGGIQPWWHHIGALHEDRRQYQTAAPIFCWHEANEDVLFDRTPLADVGVAWSQENHDFHGQDRANDRTMNPYRGVARALDRAGIPWLPVHADAIGRAAGRFKVLVLPNLAAMSDAQAAAAQAFATAGGSIVATSESSLYGEYGEPRGDFTLASLFGVHRGQGSHGGQDAPPSSIERSPRHTYLRLAPELRAAHDGPRDATAPAPEGARHPVLAGLDAADMIPFGGYLPVVTVDAGVQVLATFIPDFPIYPPETAWMRTPRTDLPAIAVRETAAGAKLVWFAADLDRCFARDDNAEHALLIANAVRWATGDRPVVALSGTRGSISPTLYGQGTRQVLHLNNRILFSRVPGRQTELIPVGPVEVRLPLRAGARPPAEVDLRVAGKRVPAAVHGADLVFTVEQVLDHEVAVIDWM
jgi:hypothetical protein